MGLTYGSYLWPLIMAQNIDWKVKADINNGVKRENYPGKQFRGK